MATTRTMLLNLIIKSSNIKPSQSGFLLSSWSYWWKETKICESSAISKEKKNMLTAIFMDIFINLLDWLKTYYEAYFKMYIKISWMAADTKTMLQILSLMKV